MLFGEILRLLLSCRDEGVSAEELKETEEDKTLDATDEKKAAFFDKIFNWISLGILVAALGAVVYLVFFR